MVGGVSMSAAVQGTGVTVRGGDCEEIADSKERERDVPQTNAVALLPSGVQP